MNKKTLSLILLLFTIAIIVGSIFFYGNSGHFFQGALNNLKPIYKSCKIEGKNFSSDNLVDCENFLSKVKNHEITEGEYTISTKYYDTKVNNSIIPVTIKDSKATCKFLENNYSPIIKATDPKYLLSEELLRPGKTLPIGENGIDLSINFEKNDQIYSYDTNICEQSLTGELLDTEKTSLGFANLDVNGFINSKESVNEVHISNVPYYKNKNNESVENHFPGNMYLKLNFAPEITFKITIPCSKYLPELKLPDFETDQNVYLPINGLTKEYYETCGDKLYLSLQNTNRKDDIQIFNDFKLEEYEGDYYFYLKLSNIARVTDKNTKFPLSMNAQVHLRERSDKNEVQTLGRGLITFTGYQENKIKKN